MIVVSDSSPLIALSSVDRLDLMQLLFDTVIIPVSVRDEVMGTAAKIAGELPSFIRVEPVAAELPVRFLKLNLHAGESEAIALALERGIQGIPALRDGIPRQPVCRAKQPGGRPEED